MKNDKFYVLYTHGGDIKKDCFDTEEELYKFMATELLPIARDSEIYVDYVFRGEMLLKG